MNVDVRPWASVSWLHFVDSYRMPLHATDLLASMVCAIYSKM